MNSYKKPNNAIIAPATYTLTLTDLNTQIKDNYLTTVLICNVIMNYDKYEDMTAENARFINNRITNIIPDYQDDK